jgi:hypothetical protein
MQKKKEQSSEERYGELGKVFSFTYGDLEANRAGFVTARQKRDLRLRFAEKFVTAIGAFLALTSIMVGFALASRTSSDTFIASILLPIVLIGLAVMLIYTWRLLVSDLRDGKVQRLEANARELGVGKSWRQAFVVLETKQEIKLTKEQFELTTERGIFRVYIAPKSREILSVETLPTK